MSARCLVPCALFALLSCLLLSGCDHCHGHDDDDDDCGCEDRGHFHHDDDDDDESCQTTSRPTKDVLGGDLTDAATGADTVADTAEDDTGAAGSWSVYGDVRLDETLDSDGRGTVYVAVLTDCGVWSSAVEVWRVLDVDLIQEPVRYAFELPAGRWHLSAFLDVDGNADPAAPRPTSGDLALRNATDGTSCVHYELGGGRGVIENALVLDAVVP